MGIDAVKQSIMLASGMVGGAIGGYCTVITPVIGAGAMGVGGIITLVASRIFAMMIEKGIIKPETALLAIAGVAVVLVGAQIAAFLAMGIPLTVGQYLAYCVISTVPGLFMGMALTKTACLNLPRQALA